MKSSDADGGGEGIGDGNIEDIFASYVERLNAGGVLDPEKILAENPAFGADIVEYLERYIGFTSPASEGGEPLGALGDYTLRRQIGRGGMGVVYEAWENSMGRRVALKVLPKALAADTRTVLRFVREAQLAGKINHPNVVSVYAMGLKEQVPYYAMEFVEGETLAQVLAGWKEAPVEEKTAFGFSREDVACYTALARAFAEAADGLQQAHSKGVIHRDIKPSNLILDRDVKVPSPGGFRLRILDFGLAHLEGQESLTASGEFLGTPLYMSPEQACRKKIAVDHRTDIYSLGATLYEMLAGRPPFQGKDHEDTLSQIIGRDPRPPRQIDSRVPRELETVVLKCLRKDPADRYGTAEALAQDLRRFVRGDPVEARPESRWGKLSRRLRRYRIAVLAAVVLVVLLGALGWSDLQRRFAELEAREAARLLHDATVRDAAIELSSGQLTLLGQDAAALSSVWFIFEGCKFKKGPAGVQDMLSALERAAEVEAGRPDAPYYLARLYRLAGDEESAGREAARALERDPDFVPAEVLAQESALGEGPLRESEIGLLLERFRGKPEPNWKVPWLQAYQHARSGSWPEAAEAYGGLLGFRGAEPYVGFSVEALMGRGIAYLNTGDFPGAVSDFAAARGIWYQLPEAGFGLGVAWRRLGQADQAEKVFLDLHAGSRGPARGEVAALIHGFYANAGEEAKAKEWFERIDGWAQAAVHCQYLNWEHRYEACTEETRKILKERPDEWAPLALQVMARLCLQWGRWGPRWDAERREILDLARKASALYPNDRHLRCILAVALQMGGRPEEAVRAIEGAIRHRSRTRLGEAESYPASIYGNILRYQGRFQEAEKVLLQALERFPGNRSLRYELARVYEHMERYEEAAEEYRALTAGGLGSAREYGQLAGILTRLGRPDEAVEMARESLRRLPRNSSGSENLARALWKLGRSAEALEAVEGGIQELPGREHLYFVRGKILEDFGRLEEAAKSFCLELELRLEDAEALEALGALLRRRPDLASTPEVQAVAEAIERKRLSGSCEALLLETLSLIRGHGKEGSAVPADSGK